MLPTPEELQATADEMKAKADSLPDGDPEKAKLLHHADLVSNSARLMRWRAFYEADGTCDDIYAAKHLRAVGRLN
jgi:hypothetical protein